MRTAICFSGHLRSFESVFHYLRDSVISPMKADVFIHTWDITGTSNNRNKGDGQATDYRVDINRIQHLANPIALTVEKETTRFIQATDGISVPEEEKIFIAGHIGAHVGMFYSIFKANQLKKEYEKLNNFTYDRVIRFRPDIRMGTSFKYDMFPDSNKVYIPKIGKYTTEGINDQVAVGSSQNIDVYCDAYNNIVEYYRRHVTTARPEMILKYHLAKNGLNIKELDINYDIYRFDGSILRQTELEGFNPGVRWK